MKTLQGGQESKLSGCLTLFLACIIGYVLVLFFGYSMSSFSKTFGGSFEPALFSGSISVLILGVVLRYVGVLRWSLPKLLFYFLILISSCSLMATLWATVTDGLVPALLGFSGAGFIFWRERQKRIAEARKKTEEAERQRRQQEEQARLAREAMEQERQKFENKRASLEDESARGRLRGAVNELFDYANLLEAPGVDKGDVIRQMHSTVSDLTKQQGSWRPEYFKDELLRGDIELIFEKIGGAGFREDAINGRLRMLFRALNAAATASASADSEPTASPQALKERDAGQAAVPPPQQGPAPPSAGDPSRRPSQEGSPEREAQPPR